MENWYQQPIFRSLGLQAIHSLKTNYSVMHTDNIKMSGTRNTITTFCAEEKSIDTITTRRKTTDK